MVLCSKCIHFPIVAHHFIFNKRTLNPTKMKNYDCAYSKTNKVLRI